MQNNSAPAKLFDPALLRRRLARAKAQGAVCFLFDHVADELAERLGVVTRTFESAIDLSPLPDLRARVAAQVARLEGIALSDDERMEAKSAAHDLCVSVLALQLVNDLPGALIQIRRALRPDGLFLAAMLGGDTLTELRQSFAEAEAECEGGVSPRVAPFADLRDIGALMQRAGFALPVVDSDRLTVRYNSVFDLMKDLRGMGATNMLTERSRKPLRRATLLRMANIYAQKFADTDGRIRATFDIIWLSGWAPDDSQQKPLKPGSATTRLIDVLKDKSAEN